MPASNQPPYTDDQFAKLEARVSNLERKRPSAIGASDLWIVAGTQLRPRVTPDVLNLIADVIAELVSNGSISIAATSTVAISGPSGVTITAAPSTAISLASPVHANNFIQLDKTGSTAFPVGNADANTGRLVIQDNSGKMELAVRFPTGAVQVIKTEP